MSSSKKEVKFDRNTKGEKKSHRSSRDSALGSSDRASLGEPHSHFSHAEIESQRQTLRAVNEALDAANARIRALEAQNAQFDVQLTASNKENRMLKREKDELHDRVEDLLEDLKEEKKANEKLRRASPPRSPTSDRSSRKPESQRPQVVVDRRNSHYEHPPMPPYTPANRAPNPFTPLSSRPALTYAPPPQAYPPNIAYAPAPAPAPAYAVSQPNRRSQQPPNDGRYHLTPL